jgi:hypothetical protein
MQAHIDPSAVLLGPCLVGFEGDFLQECIGDLVVDVLLLDHLLVRELDLAVKVLKSCGHIVRTQHGITASAGQRRGDVEIRSFLPDAAGRWSLVFDLSMTHDRFGSSSHVQQNGLLSHPQDLDAPLRLAVQRKINNYRQQYADNQNISFLPAIVSTSTRMQGEFLRLLFLQDHRKTEAHFTATGTSSQRNQSDSFRFKCAAFY